MHNGILLSALAKMAPGIVGRTFGHKKKDNISFLAGGESDCMAGHNLWSLSSCPNASQSPLEIGGSFACIRAARIKTSLITELGNSRVLHLAPPPKAAWRLSYIWKDMKDKVFGWGWGSGGERRGDKRKKAPCTASLALPMPLHEY